MLRPNVPDQITAMVEAGVRFCRIDYTGSPIWSDQNATWNGQGGDRKAWNFRQFAFVADQLAAAGITEMPIIDRYTVPPWAGESCNALDIWSSPALYAQFAAGVVAHITQKYPQITRVELFNEPNEPGWWTYPSCNPPADYDARWTDQTGLGAAIYMQAAYSAIKVVNPNMIVVGPALADGGDSHDPRGFLKNMIAGDPNPAAGLSPVPGCHTGNAWDVFSQHNYSWINPTYPFKDNPPNQFYIYKQQLALIDAADAAVGLPTGVNGAHVMLTEWGYSTQPTSADAFAPAVQAEYIGLGFNLMLADPRVDGVVYVNIWNPGTDFWGYTALTDQNVNPLPALYEYQSFAGPLTGGNIPPAPTGLQAANGGSGTIGLSWLPSPGALTYNIYRGTTPGGESSVPLATDVVSTHYTETDPVDYSDTSLVNGVTYYYTVQAVDCLGSSGLSNEAGNTPSPSFDLGFEDGNIQFGQPVPASTETYDAISVATADNDTPTGYDGTHFLQWKRSEGSSAGVKDVVTIKLTRQVFPIPPTATSLTYSFKTAIDSTTLASQASSISMRVVLTDSTGKNSVLETPLITHKYNNSVDTTSFALTSGTTATFNAGTYTNIEEIDLIYTLQTTGGKLANQSQTIDLDSISCTFN